MSRIVSVTKRAANVYDINTRPGKKDDIVFVRTTIPSNLYAGIFVVGNIFPNRTNLSNFVESSKLGDAIASQLTTEQQHMIGNFDKISCILDVRRSKKRYPGLDSRLLNLLHNFRQIPVSFRMNDYHMRVLQQQLANRFFWMQVHQVYISLFALGPPHVIGNGVVMRRELTVHKIYL